MLNWLPCSRFYCDTEFLLGSLHEAPHDVFMKGLLCCLLIQLMQGSSAVFPWDLLYLIPALGRGAQVHS